MEKNAAGDKTRKLAGEFRRRVRWTASLRDGI
jgi:hypothetical protein